MPKFLVIQADGTNATTQPFTLANWIKTHVATRQGVLLVCAYSARGKEETRTAHQEMPSTGDNNQYRPLCPDCEDNLYFRRTSTGIVFVYCQDCSSIWLRPDATGWGDVANVGALRDHFQRAGDNRPLDIIFDSSAWATRAEIMADTRWACAIDLAASVYCE